MTSNPSGSKTAFFIATDSILRAAGATAIETENGNGISYRGWTFTTKHGPIADDAKQEEIKSTIMKISNSEAHLRLPEMVFDSNILEVVNSPLNFRMLFSAKDALIPWAAGHDIGVVGVRDRTHKYGSIAYPLEVISVPYAKAWKDNSQLEGVKLLREWDWTFCTDYCASISAVDRSGNDLDIKDVYIIRVDDLETVDRYVLTPRLLSEICDHDQSRDIETSRGFDSRIRRPGHGEIGIDFDMLRQREDILFYDEILLYQGDLEDCGEVLFDVKVRVMPSCWFILARLFLRVDAVETRIRSYRYFHKFGSEKVDVDISWQVGKEERLQELFTAQAIPAFTTVLSRGLHGAPDVPVEIPRPRQQNFFRDANKLSELLGSVNDIERICKSIVIDLFPS